MATTLTIPTVVGVPYYTLVTKLDGREFNLRMAWNQTEGRWYLDINDTADVPLAVGIKLVCNRALLRFYQWDKRLPPGDLRVLDLSDDLSPPGLNELALGKRCELTYFAVTDL